MTSDRKAATAAATTRYRRGSGIRDTGDRGIVEYHHLLADRGDLEDFLCGGHAALQGALTSASCFKGVSSISMATMEETKPPTVICPCSDWRRAITISWSRFQ